MKRARLAIAALALLAAACETIPTSSVETPSGPAAIPSSPLDLGDWRNASAPSVLSQFQNNVNARYAVGQPISAVTADMRRNEFACGAPARADGRGAPPAQVCRKTVTNSGCTHTWQVHFFDQENDARLARTRGLYDRRCGDDGLLGGPG